jgi:hypothetical protein
MITIKKRLQKEINRLYQISFLYTKDNEFWSIIADELESFDKRKIRF